MALSPAAAAKGGGSQQSREASPLPQGRRGPDGTKDASRQLLDDYVLGDELGQGAFGVVYACARRGHKDESRAVKMVDKVETPVREIKREAEILEKVIHPNIIRFHEVFYEKCFVCIVMDRYLGGDMIAGMQHHWETKGRIPCEAVKHVKRQCVVALDVLHSKGVVHRDIKGDNYLLDRLDILDPQCKVVLTDFGTAIKCKVAEHVRGFVGTRTYWSPEFYANDYGQKVDIWAFGVIVYGLLEGRFPFKDEEGVKIRKPRLHSDLPDDCVDFVRSLLKKEENRRSNAAEAVAHPWVAAAPEVRPKEEEIERKTPRIEGEEWKKDSRCRFNSGGPAAANRERRYELVERLENQAGGKGPTLHFLEPQFEIAFRHEKKSVTFEWTARERVEASGIWNPNIGRIVKVADCVEDESDHTNDSSGLFDKQAIQGTLKEHGFNTDLWGTGEAKTLDEFMSEVRTGATRLMLDAAEYKKMVRVVDVVLLRVSYRKVTGEKKYLIETGEKFPDGRTRSDLNRLPGMKKEPAENVKKVTARILKETLGFGDWKILFDFKAKEVCEEEEESLSFPGVRTVYRKEIVEGQVLTSDFSVLRRIGAEGKNSEYQFSDTKNNTKYFQWFTEKESAALNPPVKMRYPKSTSQISGLVVAPIRVNEDALQKYLETSGIDVGKFGTDNTKSLHEFADELSNSEASLTRDRSGKVMRVVDVVALLLIKEDTKQILLKTTEKYNDGTTKAKPLLPGAKRLNAHENQFQAAYRILERQLKIDENHVNLDAETVMITEDLRDSPSYPGLQTLYRKRIITGEVSTHVNAPDQAAEAASAPADS